jgi:DNA polymerase-3 subunit beta
MKFELQREELLKPLQTTIGVVERRQTMPILANVLFQVDGDRFWITGTDLEIEMVAQGVCVAETNGSATMIAWPYAQNAADFHWQRSPSRIFR